MHTIQYIVTIDPQVVISCAFCFPSGFSSLSGLSGLSSLRDARNNLDSDGATSVQEFLLMARKAAQMVEEANQITAEVKPGGSLGEMGENWVNICGNGREKNDMERMINATRCWGLQ